jgi:hypothetical protein
MIMSDIIFQIMLVDGNRGEPRMIIVSMTDGFLFVNWFLEWNFAIEI